jgi:hypothetical protein
MDAWLAEMWAWWKEMTTRQEATEVNSWVFCQDLKNKRLDIVEGLASSAMEKETAHRLRAGDVRVLATLGSLTAPTKRRIFIVCILLCHDVEKKADGSTTGLTGTLWGNHSAWVTLRREQQERVESNNHENQATERNVRPSTSPWKRRNGGTP